MSFGRFRGVKNKSGHSAGGARASSGRKRLDSAISQAAGNSTQDNLVNLFYILLQ